MSLQTHRFSIQTQLSYQLSQDGWILLNMAVMSSPSQRIVSEKAWNSLGKCFREQTASSDSTRFHGLAAPAGDLEVFYEAEVESDVARSGDLSELPESALIDLPPEIVRFLYPSRYCESDKLVRLAGKEFGDLLPGHERVAGICNWIHDRIDYQSGITNAHTSAVECLTVRAGVCRDFAHLGIALCRAMGIPARYGSAYAFGLPLADFHAIFEVWLGGHWWYYDATRLAPQHGFLRVGIGHDAADTSVATMSSCVEFASMQISVEKLSESPVSYAEGPVRF